MQTDADEQPWAELMDVVIAIAREVQMHGHPTDAVGLVATEQNVIRYIDKNPGSSPSDVAAGTGLQRSNLSAALRTLEARGFVERRADPSDARRIQLWHTEAADENLTRLRNGWSTLILDALRASGSPADTHSARDALRLLSQIETGLTADRRTVPADPEP